MAYQPKSYRKFLAVAATATVIESAIEPKLNRDELTSLLELKTNYSFEYLQSLTKEQLLKLYEDKENGKNK